MSYRSQETQSLCTFLDPVIRTSPSPSQAASPTLPIHQPRFRPRQHPEALPESQHAPEEDSVIRHRPRDFPPPSPGGAPQVRQLSTAASMRPPRYSPRGSLPPSISAPLAQDRRVEHVLRSADLARHGAAHRPPQAWQAHPVAEGVAQDHAPEAAGAEEDERGVPAEDGGVAELEEGREQGGQPGRARVRQLELVAVVDVRDAEVERGEEDEAELAGGGVGLAKEGEGEEEGAEEELFRERALRIGKGGGFSFG